MGIIFDWFKKAKWQCQAPDLICYQFVVKWNVYQTDLSVSVYNVLWSTSMLMMIKRYASLLAVNFRFPHVALWWALADLPVKMAWTQTWVTRTNRWERSQDDLKFFYHIKKGNPNQTRLGCVCVLLHAMKCIQSIVNLCLLHDLFVFAMAFDYCTIPRQDPITRTREFNPIPVIWNDCLIGKKVRRQKDNTAVSC